MDTSTTQPKSIIIIGAGIAGMTAGIYAQRAGYQSQIFEMHTLPGGLMTAWKRKGYTIDGCIHWLTWSSPSTGYYRLWEEIGLLHGQEIFDPEIFMVYEGRDGKVVTFYTDLDRFEKHLIDLGPEDEKLIREICAAARAMAGFQPPAPSSGNVLRDLSGLLKLLPKLIRSYPVMQKWSGKSLGELSARFKNSFLAEVFSNVWGPEMSAGGMIFTLGYLHARSAGYPMGGSLPLAQGVEKRYRELGGVLHYGCRVEKILVENGNAVGIRLSDGSEHRADHVISAADGHATIFDMLDGRFINDEIRKTYSERPLFPPVMLVSIGVNRTFSELPCTTSGINFPIEKPIEIGGEKVDRLGVMVYNFDPSLAPQGKTVLQAMIPTGYQHWKDLSGEPEHYQAEKERIGLEVIQHLDQRFAGFAGQVEMADVATPVTFERFTGNWQGSYEGFLPVPNSLMVSLPKTLPGLSHFYMAGQWVQVGGGLPSGLMTGREVIQRICKEDRIKFK